MIGILGGMGTIATQQFLQELIDFQNDVKIDQDYIDYVLYNYASVPDRTAHILGESEDSPVPCLVEGLKKLSLMEPELIVVPCNTAHHYFDQMQAATDIPVIDMVQATVDEIAATEGFKRVLILATEGSVKCQIYDRKLVEKGLVPLVPDDEFQNMISRVIYEVVKKNKPMDKELYQLILEKMKTYELDVVLLGCTELSTAFNEDYPLADHMIDPQKVVVKRIFEILGR